MYNVRKSNLLKTCCIIDFNLLKIKFFIMANLDFQLGN